MRKRLSVIIISVALLTNCLGVISRADSGWKSYAQEIDLDAVYTDALEASDYEYEINKGSIGHMYIYTDAFSFSVPKDV